MSLNSSINRDGREASSLHHANTENDHCHAERKNCSRHRRLARHRPRQRAGAREIRRAGAGAYASGAKEAESVVAEIRKSGGRADLVATDLGAPDGPHKLAQQVRAVVGDRLDILVANAGVSKAATIEETTIEDFDSLFAVNVRAPFFLVQQLLPILHEGSSVVLLSSLAAHAATARKAQFDDRETDAAMFHGGPPLTFRLCAHPSTLLAQQVWAPMHTLLGQQRWLD
jgi:hypothetical protein